MERSRPPPPPPPYVPTTRQSGSATQLTLTDTDVNKTREVQETRFIIGLDYGTTYTGTNTRRRMVVI
jgi:hypothetical protein